MKIKELIKKLNSNLDIADIKAILKGNSFSIETFNSAEELVEFIKKERITKAVVVLNNQDRRNMIKDLLEEMIIGISKDGKIKIAY